MYSIGDAIHDFGGSQVIKTKLVEAKVLNIWGEVVGPLVKENTRPQRISNGILFVKTKSPSWAQELKVLDIKIKRALNGALGFEMIKEIRFSYDGSINKIMEEDGGIADVLDIEPIELTEDEEDFIKTVFSELQDDDLKLSMERLLKKSKKLSRLRKAMLETAEDMHRIGIYNDEEYSKITMRYLGVTANADIKPCRTGAQ